MTDTRLSMQTYVAGDRVVTDPLCKPFSMGRCSLMFSSTLIFYLVVLNPLLPAKLKLDFPFMQEPHLCILKKAHV